MNPVPKGQPLLISAWVAALLMGLCCVLICQIPIAHGLLIDRIVARVNDDVITLSQLQEDGLPLFERLRATFSGEELESEVRRAEREILDQLILKRLQLQYASQINLKASENDVNAAVKDVLTRNNLTEETLVEMLGREGLTIQDYKERVREQIILARLLNQAVRSRVSVDSSEVDAYYQAHEEEFKQPDAARVRHIFFRIDPGGESSVIAAIQQRATQVLQEARNGRDFESLARRYSEDATAANGGDLGVIRRGQTVAAFEEAVFSLREGDISEVIRTPNGLHIVKVERSSQGSMRSLAEAREEVERRLLQEKMNVRFREWTNDLRNKAFIEINLPDHDGER